MPASLKSADIDILGREFSRAYVQGISSFPDIHGMRILIGDKYFIVHQMGKGFFLVIVSRTPDLPRDILELIPGEADPLPPPNSGEENL